jgi:hypothetical protein
MEPLEFFGVNQRTRLIEVHLCTFDAGGAMVHYIDGKERAFIPPSSVAAYLAGYAKVAPQVADRVKSLSTAARGKK